VSRRIRQVRREFWSDSLVGRWPDGLRLFYIGLWCVADDDGYLEWDVPSIAADLYRYRSTTKREADVAKWLSELVSSGRLVRQSCGRHGWLPTLTGHQVVGGRRNTEVHHEHMAESGMADHGQPRPAMADGKVRNGKESNGSSSRARAPEGAGEAGDDDAPMPGTPAWEALGDTLAMAAAGHRTRRSGRPT
jgi:hypothetical protein